MRVRGAHLAVASRMVGTVVSMGLTHQGAGTADQRLLACDQPAASSPDEAHRKGEAPGESVPQGDAGAASPLLSTVERERRLREVDDLIAVIAPVVEQDGGSIVLGAVDAESGVIALTLTGACGSCAVSSATLRDGIGRIFAQRLSWFTRLDGSVEASDDTGTGRWVPR